MRMAGDKHCDLRKFRRQSHYCIGKIIATSARLESHVTCQHDRVRASVFRPRNRAANGLDRMPKIKSPGKFGPKPKRHPRRGDADDCEFDTRNLLQNERLNFCKWMVCIWKFASGFLLQ